MTKSSPKMVVLLACLTFLVFGMFNSAIGPILGELASLTNSSLAAVGGVLTFLFLGAWISQMITGPLMDRIGRKPIIISSLVILAVGITFYTQVHSLPWLFALFLLTGLGQGGVVLSINLLAVDAYPEKSTTYLNLINFIFGVGAFSGPALVSLVIRLKQTGLLVHWILAGLFVLLAVLIMIFYHEKVNPKRSEHPTLSAPKSSLYRSPLIWMLGFMVLAYVGVEYGLGSWSTAFMNATANMSTQNGALVTSAYWGCLALGRLAGTLVSRKLNMFKQLGIAISGALVSSVIFSLLLGKTDLIIIPLVVISFFFGTIYPTAIAVTTRAFPEDQGKAYGLVGSMGSVGGLTLPWLAGILLEQVSPLAFTLFVTAAIGAVLLFFTAAALQIKKRKTF